MIVACVVTLWLLVRTWAALAHLGWGTGHDVALYQFYAERWGAVPCQRRRLSSGVSARRPAVVHTATGSSAALPITRRPSGSRWLASDAWSAVCSWSRAPNRAPSAGAVPLLAGGLYTFVTAALFPVPSTRASTSRPAVLVLGALCALHRERWAASAVLARRRGGDDLPGPSDSSGLVGVGASPSGRDAALGAAALVVAGALGVSLPALTHAGRHAASFLEYQTARGIQIEAACGQRLACSRITQPRDRRTGVPVRRILAHVALAASRFAALRPTCGDRACAGASGRRCRQRVARAMAGAPGRRVSTPRSAASSG